MKTIEKSTFLSVPRKMLKTGYNPKRLLFYLQINELSRNSYSDEFVITPEILGFYIYGSSNPKLEKEIVSVLGTMDVVQHVCGNIYKCNKSSFKSDSFVTITSEEFHTIMNSGKKNAVAILEYYLRLLASFDFTTNIGHMSSQYFIETYNMTKNTLSSYNSILEELQLIYVHHRKMKSNLYCRYKDKHLLERQYDNSAVANFHRSVSSRYNRFMQDPATFSEEELQKLYEDCLIYNQDMEKMQETNPGTDYISKQKDITELKVHCHN